MLCCVGGRGRSQCETEEPGAVDTILYASQLNFASHLQVTGQGWGERGEEGTMGKKGWGLFFPVATVVTVSLF